MRFQAQIGYDEINWAHQIFQNKIAVASREFTCAVSRVIEVSIWLNRLKQESTGGKKDESEESIISNRKYADGCFQNEEESWCQYLLPWTLLTSRDVATELLFDHPIAQKDELYERSSCYNNSNWVKVIQRKSCRFSFWGNTSPYRLFNILLTLVSSLDDFSISKIFWNSINDNDIFYSPL